MFFCFNCKKRFEDLECKNELVGSFWGDPAYEEHAICPYCGEEDDIEERIDCAICGEEFSEEDLLNGICKSCSQKDFEYETALKYLVETDRLRSFFLEWYWEVSEKVNDNESAEFDELLVSVFNSKVREDKETNRTVFYSLLKEYIFNDIYDWTEFLEKEAKR
jgi:hypothetical protein